MRTSVAALMKSGFLLALVGTFLFSLKPIVIKEVYQYDIESIQLLTLRMIFALPFYLFVVATIWRSKPHNRQLYSNNIPRIMFLGFLGYYLASFLDMEALQFISAQLERIVLFCFPTLVVLFSKWWLKTELPKNIWWVIGISYCGILMIFGHDLSNLGSEVAWGTALVFTSAVIFASYVTLSKAIIAKLGSRCFTSVAMLSASLFIFLHFSLVKDWQSLLLPIEVYYRVLILAFFCTVLPSFLMSEAIAQIGPERSSVIGTAGPVFTSIIAVIWLDEAFTIFHFVGLCMVCFAIALMGRR